MSEIGITVMKISSRRLHDQVHGLVAIWFGPEMRGVPLAG
jgi:hypothetical protein